MKAASSTPPDLLLADGAEVTGFLENLFDGMGDSQLVRAMQYATLDGGKRVRAGLVMGAARLAGGDSDAGALRVAAAFECLHAYSLIHDDLPAMDDAATRRGKPSCHAAFGEATAILAGDALQSLAFELLADPDTRSDGGVRAALVLELARASGVAGMAGGQMLDLEAEKGNFDMEQTAKMQSMKTGALITAALRCGGIIGGAGGGGGNRLMEGLDAFGKNIGLAFQIADDVLDRTATGIGKPVGRDSDAGKASFTDHLGIDGAHAEAIRLVDEAVAALRVATTDDNPHLDYMAELADFIARRGH